MATLEIIINEFARQVGKDIGNLGNLTTTNKTNLVQAINEIILTNPGGGISSIEDITTNFIDEYLSTTGGIIDEDLTINFVDIYNTAKTL